MKAAIYTRIARTPTAWARAWPARRTTCRQLCHRKGWEVVEPVYADNDHSAFLASPGASTTSCRRREGRRRST